MPSCCLVTALREGYILDRWPLVGSAGVIQLVECQLPKLDVAGSSPVARSVTSWNIEVYKNRLPIWAADLFLRCNGHQTVTGYLIAW